MQPDIHAVVFDMGNTLWFEAHPLPAGEIFERQAVALAPLVEGWRVHLDAPIAQLLRDIWAAYETAAAIEREARRDTDPSLPFLVRGALATHGVDISDAQAEEWWRTAYLPVRVFGWQLYPDTLDVLRELKALGIRVGVNTNRPFTAEMFMRDLHDFALAPYIDAAVCSGDTGFCKPHRSTFSRILALLDVAADETVMVGDDCRGDMKGGRAAGMRTVWKLNGRHDASPCAEADYAIHDLAELLALPLFHRQAPPIVSKESRTPHEDNNEDRY